ncbi:MAG TPA: TetR family transcriptional regulator [Rhizomicrobium sp.]|nr:TetR family transcriptional regulator [Rhizomicrobium sp.]
MPGIFNITRKPAARPYWVSARERASTRARLLDAARSLVARDGETALTLGGVADEAGIARATVYGYFTGKKDLLAALEEAASLSGPEGGEAPDTAKGQSDAQSSGPGGDIVIAAPDHSKSTDTTRDHQEQAEFAFSLGSDAVLAAAIAAPRSDVRDCPPVPEPESSASGAEEPATDGSFETVNPLAKDGATTESEAKETVDSSEFGADVEAPGCAGPDQQDPQVLASGSEDHGELTPFERERRLQATHLEEIAKRLILPESALKEGTDAVISRLDTRLRVLERSIASLESRQNAIPDETTKKLKPISDLVIQLQTRADAMEDRQRQALAELRLSVHELAARQNALGAVPIAVSEMPAWPEPAPTSAEDKEGPVQDAPCEEGREHLAPDEARSTYLSTARNLAKEGARQAAERELQLAEDLRRRRRHVLTAAGVAGVCLVVVGGLFALRPGPQGVSVAQSKSISRTGPAKSPPVGAARAPLDRLTALANQGDTRAEVVVGLRYLKGDGVPASEKDAARWFERAARSGNAVAQNYLGALYQSGRGVPVDLNQAMHWYEASAMQGDRHAMSNLAVLYAGGAGGSNNFAEAARWFQRSAELGFVDAQFNLAVLFERGDGVPQSLLDAYQWYSIAAAAGDPVAKARAGAIATQVSPEELQAAQQVAANFQPRPMNRAANDVPTMADVLASR